MTTMLSLILAFMLTMGGSPAVSVSPVNSIGPESGVSHDITGKPRLGEFLKIYPVETRPNAGNPRLVLNLSFQYKKSPLINLNQAFNMNPYNFTDPWGLSLKLSGSEMQQFEYNLTNILIDLYRENYDAETADLLIDFVIHTATLENKVWAFNRVTGLNLDVPEKLGILGKIFGAAKSYANFSKQVGAKVKQWLGADEAQERIDSAEDHWLVQEGVTLPGHLTIGDQLNLAFAEVAATVAELTTEELQWAVLAGVLKGVKAFYHRHHTIPTEIRKKLPPKIRNHPDIIGRKGLPNRKEVEAGEHLGIIHKGYRGGAYNKRFEEEILKRGGYESVTVDDILEIRDMLVKEFGIK
jgi:dUTPase